MHTIEYLNLPPDGRVEPDAPEARWLIAIAEFSSVLGSPSMIRGDHYESINENLRERLHEYCQQAGIQEADGPYFGRKGIAMTHTMTGSKLFEIRNELEEVLKRYDLHSEDAMAAGDGSYCELEGPFGEVRFLLTLSIMEDEIKNDDFEEDNALQE